MSITLTGNAGYFTRCGVWVGEFNRVAALYGTALTQTAFESIWLQYASSDQAAVVGLPNAQASYQSTPTSYLQYLGQSLQTSSQLQVADAFPPNTFDFISSVLAVKAQMVSTSQSINKPTITATITAGGSNVGNAQFTTSILNPYGVQSDTIYAETVSITCTNNSSPFSETFQAVANAAVPFTAYNWPQGSGVTRTIPMTNPATTTLVTDGMFVNWSGTGNNTPTNWIIVNGTAGTQVLQGTSPVRSGFSFSASLVSDGTSTTQLAQAVSLSPNTAYAFSIQVKTSSLDGSGQFRIALTNGSGTILQNSAGNNLSQTFGTNGGSGVGTSYSVFTVYFATPLNLPSTVWIQYGMSTSMSAGKTLSLDMAAGTQATQLYNQGQFIAAFSGSTLSNVGDTYSAVYTNSLNTQSFVRGLQRVLNLSNLGSSVYFPSSVSPTIPDSLITNP